MIAQTVELDEITRAFDAPTRAAFQVWQQQQALAGLGRGQDFNDAIAQFAPLEEEATQLLTVLNQNAASFSRLVRNTGVVFGALSARDRQLASLITNSNRVFAVTGRLNTQLAQTFVALPTFQKESVLTLNRLVQFADDTNPLINQLKPVATEFGPTMQELEKLAPVLNGLVTNLDPAISASTKGFPAINSFLTDAAPFFASLDPSLQQLTPLLQYVGAYPSELTAFFANVTAATNAQADVNGKNFKYLRTTNPLSPLALASYPARPQSDRPNPYTYPRPFDKLATSNMPLFQTSQCTTGITPFLAPTTAAHDRADADRSDQPVRARRQPVERPGAHVPAAGDVHRERQDDAVPAGRGQHHAAAAEVRLAVRRAATIGA